VTAMTTPTEAELRQGGSPHEGEDLEAWEAAQEAAKLLSTLSKEITPTRVAMAGAVLLMLITMTLSGWYWLLPRDAVTVETQYMQRGGHLMMAELHNDGSRAITDVVLEIEFQTLEGDVLDRMALELREMAAHTSIAGDELEMMVVGHTVWDEYLVVVDIEYRDYSGSLHEASWSHTVGVWSQEIFHDKADRHVWPFN
jgi:hypothetical protein